MKHQLDERQKEILNFLVLSFIVTATPIPSHYIAKNHRLKLSPATIRNIMAQLEEWGYLSHPYTSAGKIPTDKGYRFFVDSLMEIETLPQHELEAIRQKLGNVDEIDELLRQTAKLLGAVSHQLSIVSTPHLRSCILDHIELISLSSNKMLVILTIKTGIVSTITIEVASEIKHENLYSLSLLLNERLSGLTLETIRDTFEQRFKDKKDEKSGIVNLFIQSADRIFQEKRLGDKLHIGGTQSFIEQPEYENPEIFRTIIELINNENSLHELLERCKREAQEKGVSIMIGEENKEEKLKSYSIIVSTYHAGGGIGSIGIIGPKRMNYPKAIPLIKHISHEISATLS